MDDPYLLSILRSSNTTLSSSVFKTNPTSDVNSEMEKLEQGHAVGDLTHRLMLREAISEYRTTLAEVIFAWSCQNPLPATDVLKVRHTLSQFLLVVLISSSYYSSGGN